MVFMVMREIIYTSFVFCLTLKIIDFVQNAPNLILCFNDNVNKSNINNDNIIR